MNVLCIDAGNSRLKWGVRCGQTWREKGTGSTADIAGLAVDATRIVASNVGGQSAQLAIEALARRMDIPLEWVHARAEQCGVRNGYERPEQLGADRWAALLGARSLHRGDALVVMCGTATTIDVLRADGLFAGGLILPGLTLMREALARGTAGLPADPGREVDLPRNTLDAISSGAVLATVGAIERMARQLNPACDPLCLISGGAANAVSPRLTFSYQHIDNLVLEGLAVMAA